MSSARSFGTGSDGAFSATRRLQAIHEEKRRSVRSGTVAAGTLACARCDAPVGLGPGAHAPGQTISCPFCDHRAPLRDFLSLAAPVRPARVLVKLRVRRNR